MGKRKRYMTEERPGVEILIQKILDVETTPKPEDRCTEHQEDHKMKRKKHKHKKELKEDEVLYETQEERTEDAKNGKTKRRKHAEKLVEEEAKIEMNTSSKLKHRKHKEKIEDVEPFLEADENCAEQQGNHKQKRKKHKYMQEIDETGANHETEIEEIIESPKKKKSRKHDKARPDEESTPKHKYVDKAVTRKTEGVDKETNGKQEWKDKTSLKKLKMQQPKMFLINNFTNDEEYNETFKPIEVKDLQDLIQYSVMGNAANTNTIRFCKLVRPALISKVVVMVLNSVSERHFQENRDCFPHLIANYDLTGQILPLDLQQNQTILNRLVYMPISKKQLKNKAFFERNLEAYHGTDNKTPTVSVPQPVKNKTTTHGRTHYLLKDEEKAIWRYPQADDPLYTHTKHGTNVSDESPIISVDCEMCVTKNGSELTRVSLVDEKYNVLYNSLVKPTDPIIDYVTRYSGISKQLLDPVTTRIEDVQRDIVALLPPDAILVGQSLENDLRALKLYHPHVADTSNLFTGSYRVSLRKLAWKYLGKTIQDHKCGHDSIEDAVVALQLLQLKIEKGDSLGNYYSNNKQHTKTVPTESIFKGAQSIGKVSMLVDSMTVAKQFMKDPVGAMACQSDSEALTKAVQAIPYSDFVSVQFYNFFKLMQGISMDEMVVKETLKQLDRRIKKIHKTLPFNSLFLIVMAEDHHNNASNKSNEELADGRFYVGLKVRY